jgi:hypothetical protein
MFSPSSRQKRISLPINCPLNPLDYESTQELDRCAAVCRFGTDRVRRVILESQRAHRERAPCGDLHPDRRPGSPRTNPTTSGGTKLCRLASGDRFWNCHVCAEHDCSILRAQNWNACDRCHRSAERNLGRRGRPGRGGKIYVENLSAFSLMNHLYDVC